MIYIDLLKGKDGEMGGDPRILTEEFINIVMNFYGMIVAADKRNQFTFKNIMESAIERAKKDRIAEKIKNNRTANKEITRNLKECEKALHEYISKKNFN